MKKLAAFLWEKTFNPPCLPHLGCPGDGRFPEEVGGLQGGGKVLTRRAAARGCPCGRTSPGTNKAANESFPRSGGPGQFVLVKFWVYFGNNCPFSCNGYNMSQDFIGCHDGSPRFRRPVLAIVGGTRLGKSMLAADILDRIARPLGKLNEAE